MLDHPRRRERARVVDLKPYDAAPLTGFQESVTGSVTVAPLAGLDSVGAVGVLVDEGVTVKVAVRLTPPRLAVIVTPVDPVTAVVAMVNVALCAPAGTVTLAGTLAAVSLRARLTTAPLPVAAALSVTVPIALLPPVTPVGLMDKDDSVAGLGDAVTINDVADHPPL